MAVDYEYFVASPDRIAALDLGKSPVSQLPAEEVAELPGVDPTVVLLGLVEVLSTREYDDLLAQTSGELVHDGGDAGPWVTAVDGFVVAAIQGADGDPELEWEDAVEQWNVLVGDEFGDGDVDQEALLETTDELRRLCGNVRGDRRLYCWTQL
ncbi:hypothetical protein [Cryptosporangium aurantiacum]|uniref:Uncharacterized protein n=1 Tax=Cryptosporangium aurantiacum TaxID=134849 RepID=A0A1M7Q741_9ACTN|nr:hypothetical protein [Cryptosporangium aurantiacum]SHN26176.1 hypothetical protein SAMN05443668_104229 [Cryptosporangium aurantiacum]